MVPEREAIAVRAGDATGWGSRYQALDAWRGLACVLVVIHHAGYAVEWSEAGGDWLRWLAVLLVRRMSLSVSLFFVISGYCIAASVSSSARRGESAGSFLARRAWRIYPPYWFALLGFLVVVASLDAAGLSRYYNGPLGVPLDPPRALDARQWLGNLTLTETWRPHIWGPERNVYTGVAWSLCFEEQFYAICCLVLCLTPRRLFAGLGLVTAAILSVRMYAWWVGGLAGLKGTFPLLWHEFAVGVVVYYRLVVAGRAWEKRLIESALVVALAVALATGGRSSAAAAAFGLVLIVLRRWDAVAATARVLAPLRACGRRCYSIYLAHLPLSVAGNHWLYEHGVTTFWGRVLVMIPLATIAGVAAGWAFHAAVESRFLTPPPRLRSRLTGWFRFGRRARFAEA